MSNETKELGINRITPSGLVEYEKCPKLFYYRTWLGLKLPQPMIHLNFGKAIHLAIDNIYEQFDRDDGWKNAELKIVKDIFKKNFLLEHVDSEGLTKGEHVRTYEDMKEDGFNILESFWNEKENLAAEHGVLPTEFETPIKLHLTLPNGDQMEIPISCRIDGLNADQNVIEFKTSKARYDENETHDSLQSLSYSTVRYIQTGKIPDVIYVVMLKGRKKDRIQVVHCEYTDADILTYIERVSVILERIRNREFSRKSYHEPYCDCIKYEKALEIT